ncbi:hypothetical protein [Isoptericola sp. G70]|uniref:hypothetical protein n=1 Tax=Isoptericola sp. G70 TaxID=3376633 RepID=UPI003A80C060
MFKAIQTCEGCDDMSVHLSLLLPRPLHHRFETDPDVRHAVDVLHKWLEHTVELLTRSDIHVAAANNKYKHGLAVRPRADERISFLKAEAVPREGDALPADAVRAEIPIFDKPFVEYLAKGPKDDSGEHGLELTRLRLDTSALLVESTMLATVYGALFHVAAAEHAAWSGTDARIAPYPSLPMGPTPQQLLGGAVVGMRSPVTFRPDGTPPTRGHAIGFANGQWVGLDVDYNGRRAMRVTDDTTDRVEHPPA